MEKDFPYLISTKSLKPEFTQFQKIPICSNEFSIGRGLDNNVVISFLALSRKHCKFKRIDQNKWTIEDLSSFGIQVNDERLEKHCAYALNPNDIIRFDVCNEFEYKFILPEAEEPPKKMRKIEEISPDVVRQKFEESQSFEIEFMESKIQSTQQLQTVSIERKKWLNLELERKMQMLKDEYALQIENLKGEKKEIEIQKLQLEQERDAQIDGMKQEMETKLNDLMEEIKQHYVKEADLLRENSILKERLMKERDDFLLILNKENSSKQGMLAELEAKINKQELLRLQEKQKLEDTLRRETEALRMAKDKELKDLEEKKRLREKELELALENLKNLLENQIEQTKQKQVEAEEQLLLKTEEMKKITEQDKIQMEQLLSKAREDAENKLAEAQLRAENCVKELQKKVQDREIELATLAADRIQFQVEQSNEVIYSLQKQLEAAKAQLSSIEEKKNSTIPTVAETGESSRQTTWAKIEEVMESELQCSVCAELLIHPLMLGCGHSFCRYCITRWRLKSQNCPNCRTPIKSEIKDLSLNSFIEKMVSNLNEDMKKKREDMLKEREGEEAAMQARNRTGNKGSVTPSTSSSSRGRRPYRRRARYRASTPIPLIDLTRMTTP